MTRIFMEQVRVSLHNRSNVMGFPKRPSSVNRQFVPRVGTPAKEVMAELAEDLGVASAKVSRNRADAKFCRHPMF